MDIIYFLLLLTFSSSPLPPPAFSPQSRLGIARICCLGVRAAKQLLNVLLLLRGCRHVAQATLPKLLIKYNTLGLQK